MEFKNNKKKITSNEEISSPAYNDLRNKILNMLHIEKTSATYIANELGVSIRTVYNYINQLKEDGELPQNFSFISALTNEEAKENLLSLIFNRKQTAKQIAATLNISVSSVYIQINNLKKSGELPQTFCFHSPQQEELEDKILLLIKRNTSSAKEIAQQLQIALPTLYSYINRLKVSGELPQDFSFTPRTKRKAVKEHKASLGKKEFKRKLVSYITKDRYRADDLANKLNVDVATIYSYVRTLKKEGEIPKDFSFKSSYTRKETEQNILYLILNKKISAKEIALELELTTPTIYEYVNNFKKQGKLPDDFSFEPSTAKKELKEQIYTLSYKSNKTAKEITDELRVTYQTVIKYINELKKEDRIPKDFSFRKTPPKKDAKDKVCFLALDEQLTIKEVSSKVGITFATVYKYINELKEEGRVPQEFHFSKNSSEKFKREIYSLAIIEEKRAKDIAEELDITHPTILFYINELKKEGRIPQEFSFRREGKNN